jgi:hypothetical protein
MSEPVPVGGERRVFVRYTRHLDVLWQMLGYSPQELTAARMMDLSKAGVAVVLPQAFEVKSHLILRLPTATHGWSTHLVQVQNCQLVAEGQYKIGCRFVRPLSEEQLAFHLE